MVLTLWYLRGESDAFEPGVVYGTNPSIFTLKIYHAGVFIKQPKMCYADGKFRYVDFVDGDAFSMHELNAMIQEIGYPKNEIMFYHFKIPDQELKFGLRPLGNDSDVLVLLNYVSKFKVIEVYTEHWVSRLNIFTNSPSKVFIEELVDPESDSSKGRPTKSPLKKRTCRKLSTIEWLGDEGGNVQNEEPVNDEGVHMQNESVEGVHVQNEEDEGVHMQTESVEGVHVQTEEDEGVHMQNESVEGVHVQTEEDEGGHLQNDEDLLQDEDNIVDEQDVNMDSFKDDIGGEHCVNIDMDEFDSADDDRDDLDKAVRKFRKEKSNCLDHAPFHVGARFDSKLEIASAVTSWALETRRQLYTNKNEKLRYSVICIGVTPAFVSGGHSEGQNEGQKSKGQTSEGQKRKTRNKKGSVGESSKKGGTTPKPRHPKPTCPWKLYLSRKTEEDSWIVKTFIPEHKCLHTRKVKLYTVSVIAKDIEGTVESNPEIPLKALQDQIQKKYQVEVHLQKIFRAKVMATKKVHGDYTAQYLLLWDYCEELRRCNPNTTVKIETQTCFDPTSDIRVFKRIYICYGALKTGFRICGRKILCLDGCFMKGPYPGQILTAVSVDGNNGIYPVAFAVVESETYNSWAWFLKCIGEDLDLNENSKITFMSDRQKGIIPAIKDVFPKAEHRFCFRHIHENMKSKWKGNMYKNMLYKCSSATTIPKFNRHMDAVKQKDKDLHKWLQDIPAEHWARSHRQLIGGRDKPIITCLEFIREYLMRRIGVVNTLIAKSTGPLTPIATKNFNKIKEDASQYTAIWNGQTKYQVTGPWNDQVVVDVEKRTCSCKRWELTGMPCRHVVAVIWNMGANGMEVGIPESWVDEVYWLDTWRQVYKNTIDPINGREEWIPSACPATLLPPKHHTQVGRPKKLRKRSADELSQKIGGVGKMPRKGRSVRCQLCKNIGHNKASCKGQGSSNPSQPATDV